MKERNSGKEQKVISDQLATDSGKKRIAVSFKDFTYHLALTVCLCFLFLTAYCLPFATAVWAQGTVAGVSVANGGDAGTVQSADQPGDTFVTGNFIGNFVVANSTAIAVSTGYAIGALPAPPDQTIPSPGTTVYFAYSVLNRGNAPDRFSLAVSTISGENWNAFVVQTDSITQITASHFIAPESTFYFLVAVQVPATAANYSSATVRLTVKDNFGLGADDQWPQGEAQNDTLTDDVLVQVIFGLPSAPVLSGISTSTSTIRWNWSYSGNPVDGFRVFSTTGGNLSGNLASTVTSFIQSGLSPGTSYSAYVQAFNSSGTANSAAVSTTTLPLPTIFVSSLTLQLVGSLPPVTSVSTQTVQYQILGGTSPYSVTLVHVNKTSETISISHSGTFSFLLNLEYGENKIELLAKDSISSTTVSLSTAIFRGMEMQVSGDKLQAKVDLSIAPAFYLRMEDADTKPIKIEINNGMQLAIPEGSFEKGALAQLKIGAEPEKLQVLKKSMGGISLISGNENNMLKIEVRGAGGKLQPQRSIVLTIPYYDPTPLDHNDDFGFKIAYFDETAGIWKLTGKGTIIDAINDKITTSIDHFTLFTSVNARAPALDFSNFIVYPNPFKPNSGDPRQGKEYSISDQESGVIFEGLTENAKVQLFNLTGEKIKELIAPAGTSRIRWDGKNEEGESVTSGIYFYVATDSKGRKITGKLAIIR